ncbi:uncharacterized protein FA14DRAFT_179823 [Meira miltonrushii]|uniref:Uncharacterized protein n=1 Tax=Meira miltonrushii TaxID=1280837 RepID=A0A316V6E5_9BASI|nr:uncharacterized protein FA14DRAFT_179823 [Meira miltonrushii]PWN33169.1 hypothetical protein FA14DRAFT_179823 [Meira miltonrushii]
MMKSTFFLSILSILFVASHGVEAASSAKMIRRTTHKGKPFILDGKDGISYECTPLPSHHPKHHHPSHHPHPHPHASSTSSSKVKTTTFHHSTTATSTSTSGDPTTNTKTRSTGTPTSSTSTDVTSTAKPTSNTATDSTSTITSTSESIRTFTRSGTTTSTTPTTTSRAPDSTATTCPPGYSEVKQGDRYISQDSDLIDLKGLTIDLNILNFGKSGKQEDSKTVPASDDSICTTSTCCVKADPGKCPNGYQTARRGDTMIVEQDNDLVDLKGLTINLDILNFGGSAAKKQKAQNGQRCDAETCCYQEGSGFTEIDQDNDLIDAKGINIDLCILSGTC